MKTPLYELSGQYLDLTRMLDEGVVDREQIQKVLADLSDIIEDKIANIGRLILSMEADALVIQQEERRLASRRQSLEKQTEHLKSYLLNEMTVCKIDKVKRPVVTVNIKINPPSVEVVSLMDIPQEYRRVIPETWQPDKVKILTQYKTYGEIVGGCEIIRDKKHIEVK